MLDKQKEEEEEFHGLEQDNDEMNSIERERLKEKLQGMPIEKLFEKFEKDAVKEFDSKKEDLKFMV